MDDPLRSGDRDTLVRLLTEKPDAEQLWSDLSRQGVREELAWRLLLDFFLGSRPGAGFDPDLKDTIKRCRDLQADIATKAGELARLLDSLAELARPAAITTPSELGDLPTLLDAAGWLRPYMQPWEAAALDRSLGDISPADLVSRLAEPAAEEQPAPMYPQQAYATSGYKKLVRPWIWNFDQAFRLYLARTIPPPLPSIGHEALARLARLILAPHLGPDDGISAGMVSKARDAAPDPLPSEFVVFF